MGHHNVRVCPNFASFFPSFIYCTIDYKSVIRTQVDNAIKITFISKTFSLGTHSGVYVGEEDEGKKEFGLEYWNERIIWSGMIGI